VPASSAKPYEAWLTRQAAAPEATRATRRRAWAENVSVATLSPWTRLPKITARSRIAHGTAEAQQSPASSMGVDGGLKRGTINFTCATWASDSSRLTYALALWRGLLQALRSPPSRGLYVPDAGTESRRVRRVVSAQPVRRRTAYPWLLTAPPALQADTRLQSITRAPDRLANRKGNGRRDMRLCSTKHWWRLAVAQPPGRQTGWARIQPARVCVERGYDADFQWLHVIFHTRICRPRNAATISAEEGVDLRLRIGGRGRSGWRAWRAGSAVTHGETKTGRP